MVDCFALAGGSNGLDCCLNCSTGPGVGHSLGNLCPSFEKLADGCCLEFSVKMNFKCRMREKGLYINANPRFPVNAGSVGSCSCLNNFD